MALLPDEHVASLLRVCRERYNTRSIDRRVNHIMIFKNHGADAGASLQHPHLQLIATPVIPSQVRHRSHEALQHDDARECMFCHMVEREVEDQTRVVLQGEHFVAMEVFASPTPFVTHIFPLRHMASFGDITDLEIADLARVLRTLLAKIYVGLENPDLNYTVRSGPTEYNGARHFHGYVSVIPRLRRVAGFELGSVMFINSVLPEAAAEFPAQGGGGQGVGSRGRKVRAETNPQLSEDVENSGAFRPGAEGVRTRAVTAGLVPSRSFPLRLPRTYVLG